MTSLDFSGRFHNCNFSIKATGKNKSTEFPTKPIKSCKPSDCIRMARMVHQTDRRVNRRTGFYEMNQTIIVGKQVTNKMFKIEIQVEKKPAKNIILNRMSVSYFLKSMPENQAR